MNTKLPEKYDIALSFVSQDENLAMEIYTELSKSLDVFIYSEYQKELADDDGISKFKEIFTERTKLRVVLFREEWGNTDWTSVEEQDNFQTINIINE